MKKILVCLGGILLLTGMNPGWTFGQRKVTIKVASIAPENTPWGEALNRLAKAWSEVSGGEVELRVYHNGVAGNEGDVLQKLKINQIQGAVLTSFGINLISPEVMTLSAPFLIRTSEELKRVLEALKPELELKISAKGFHTLTWANAGWVTFFSKSPVFIPSDLKRLKIGTRPEAPELAYAFRSLGYQMVTVSDNDILIALNSNKIQAFYQSPLFAGAMQLFGSAQHMTSLPVAPFMAGIFLNEPGWRAIPERYKPEFMRRAEAISGEINASVIRLEADAVKTMTQYGLKVHQIAPNQAQLWYSEVDGAIDSLLGAAFDRAVYQRVQALLADFRR
ncbi:MAG: TRAP transporter substrate-binding protein DctP [Spirochaetaceae bacterium]|nr:TRAP transporter substrate-binding protein DctP [Spirochaetaceae bacterium]